MRSILPLFVFFLLLANLESKAQLNYKPFASGISMHEGSGLPMPTPLSNPAGREWGVGVRLGVPTAFSVKHYMGDVAYEANLGSDLDERLLLQLHYLIQYPTEMTDLWVLYYGLGPQIRVGSDIFDFGVDGVVGTEYSFDEFPFSVFLDLIIFAELVDDPLDIDLQGGLGLRYEF